MENKHWLTAKNYQFRTLVGSTFPAGPQTKTLLSWPII